MSTSHLFDQENSGIVTDPTAPEDSSRNSKERMYKVLLSEKYTSGKEIYYTRSPDKTSLVVISSKNTFTGNVQHGFKEFFHEIFLPQGYPSSVSADYTQYQIWDTAQAFCSTITGTLATHAVMKGVGVGDVEATPLAATITWVLKEGTGNIGRIAFAWWKGTSLDADSKKWRLMADCLNDAAICLELTLPFFKGYTTYVLCVSTAMKSIVGVAGGATRAALTQHQAIRGNLADVAAKDGSQETAVNLIASFVAVFIISLVGQNIWLIFFVFTICHLISNYNAVSSVCLDTFNSTRFLHTLLIFLQHQIVLPPSTVNSSEPVLFFEKQLTEQSLCGFKIKVGSSLKRLVTSRKITLENMKCAIVTFEDFNYLIVFDVHKKYIHIVLEESIESKDILQAYFHAVIFGIVMSAIGNEELMILNESHKIIAPSKNSFSNTCGKLSKKYNYSDIIEGPTKEIYKDIDQIVNKKWSEFQVGAQGSGWSLDKNLIITEEWRGNWSSKALEGKLQNIDGKYKQENLKQD